MAPTPLGPTILAYRLIFFLIEILPISLKIFTSLRRRRPYERTRAALEEAHFAHTYAFAYQHHDDTATVATERSDRRRAVREAIPDRPEPVQRVLRR